MVALVQSPRPQGTVPIAHDGWHGCFVLRDAQEPIQRGVARSGRFHEREMLEDLRRHRPALYVEVAEDHAYPGVAELLRPLGYRVADRFNVPPTYLFLAAA